MALAPPQGSSHDKVAEFREAFDLLDLAGEGFADIESTKALLIAVCPGLTEKKLNDILEAIGYVALPRITFAQFYVVVNNVRNVLGLHFTADEMRDFAVLHQAFAPFDKENTGTVDADIFMALMMEKGRKLSSHEGVEMRSRLERMGFMKKGKVNYRAFLNHISSCVE